MPPQDTIYILDQEVNPPSPVKEVFTDTFDNGDTYRYYIIGKEKDSSSPSSDPSGLIFVIIIAGVLFFTAGAPKIEAFFQRLKRKRNLKNIQQTVDEKKYQYEYWLNKFNPYYRSLSPELRNRFLLRTVEFMEAKEFHYHFMEPAEEHSLLISAAAVQLTFGLKNFLVSYFPVINVVKSAYSVGDPNRVLEGHVRVDNHSINISWDSFITDYEDYSDSQNVGLHEMAHAISFDFLYGNQENRNADFTARFKEYVQEARPAFKNLCSGRNDLLDDYGTVNVEEFWAVAVETFFEKGLEFRTSMPDLYDAMAEVLNQDPLREEKIINKRLAGLAI